uniref:Uncharacterized protein n=1 Tax=Ascaris lumbricoides TaxID=6252 RepID=A0A0M3HTX7_ASCLU
MGLAAATLRDTPKEQFLLWPMKTAFCTASQSTRYICFRLTKLLHSLSFILSLNMFPISTVIKINEEEAYLGCLNRCDGKCMPHWSY